MVAPGEGLMFGEGEKFSKAFKNKPAFVQKIKNFYATHPDKFHRVQGPLFKGDMPDGHDSYQCLILRRCGARVYLLAVAKVEGGVGIHEADLEYFKKSFGK